MSILVIPAVVLGVVTQNPRGSGLSVPSIFNQATAAGSEAQARPLDQVSSADIALTVARMNGLPEATAITNQAQSQAADIAAAAPTNNIISKPQVVATALKSRADIQAYTTKAGDSVSSVAAQFGVTSDSIRWSNGLNTDNVAPGTKLNIPPVNGVVYTVQASDTADSLAARFRANKDKIVAYNDAEIKGLTPGQQIIIPDAVQINSLSAAAVASPSIGGVNSTSFPWGGSSPVYGSNGYDYGYCTWYVATQIAVPSNWGNASSWSYYAGMSGWKVSSVPTVGAIGQTPAGGLGHVAVVMAVSEDGSQIQYRDMNGIAGWGRVGYSGWVSPAKFPHYISH